MAKAVKNNVAFETAIARMGAIGGSMAEFDTGSDLIRKEAIELLRKYPAQLAPMQDAYLSHYIAKTLKKDAVYGRAVLTKGGIDSSKEDKRTKAEHDAWNAAKVSFAGVRRHAGLTDEKKAAVKNASHAAKTEKASKENTTAENTVTPKASAKLPVYKNAGELAQFNLMNLASLSATNDANAKLIKDNAMMEKIARIIRTAKAEIEAELKA